MIKQISVAIGLLIILFSEISMAQNGLNENFDSFELGNINGQFGWTTNQESNHNDSFIIDAGIPEFGDRSLFHEVPDQLPIFFEIRSPAFSTDAGVGLFFDVWIENDQHAFSFKPWDLGKGIQNTVLSLATDGRITALQFTNSGFFTSVNHLTTGHWEPNQITRLGFIVTEDGDLQIFQDGEEIFFGHDMASMYPFGNGTPSGISQLRIEKGLSGVSETSSVIIDNISNSMIRVLKGDINQDGTVNLLDVQPFVDLLALGTFQNEADINDDSEVNLLDVAGFVSLLSN